MVYEFYVLTTDLTWNAKSLSTIILEDENDTVIENIENINAKNENVFFVETQNTTNHTLSRRQACSIESAGMLENKNILNLCALSKFNRL